MPRSYASGSLLRWVRTSMRAVRSLVATRGGWCPGRALTVAGLLLAAGCDSSHGAAGSSRRGSDASPFFGTDPRFGKEGPWRNRTPRPPLPADWPLDGQMLRLAFDGALGRVVLFGGGVGDH